MAIEESSGQCLSPFVTPLDQRRLVIVTVDRKASSANVVHSAAKEGFASAMLRMSKSVAKTSVVQRCPFSEGSN